MCLTPYVGHIALPLTLNLVWAFVLLIGVPTVLGGYPLSFLRYATPDLGYFLIVSGGIALAWGPLRMALAYLALRGTNIERHPQPIKVQT